MCVVSDPCTNQTRTRVIAQRSAKCFRRNHDVGERFFLWEMLPDTARYAQVSDVSEDLSASYRRGVSDLHGVLQFVSEESEALASHISPVDRDRDDE